MNRIINGELETTVLLDLAVHAVHVLHDIVRTAVGDLVTGVGGADCNDDRAASYACADTRRRVLPDETTLGVVPEALGGEDEWVRRGLAGLETLVAGGDGYRRRDDSDAGHGAIGYKQNTISIGVCV